MSLTVMRIPEAELTVSLSILCFLFLWIHWKRFPPSQSSITINSCLVSVTDTVSRILTTWLSSIWAWIWTLERREENMKKFPLSKYVETVSIKRVLGLSPRRLGCKAIKLNLVFMSRPAFHSLRVGGARPGPTTTPMITGHLSVNGLTNPLNCRSKG